MSQLSELIEEAKRRRVSIKNQDGKTLIDISLLLAVIIAIAVPQLLLIALIGVVLELIDVDYDGQKLEFGG